MLVANKRSIDMTKGPLFGKIMLFVLPLMATNLLQVFYNAADTMIAGLSSDPNAVGAVGSTGAFLSLVVNIFIGFSAGTDVVVARNIGAKRDKDVSAAVHTSICMSLIFGILGALIGIAVTRPVFLAMGYTGNLLALAERYVYIYLACLPFLSLTNFLSAVMRAKGDTRTPLIVMATTGLLNVCLNLVFVLVFNMTVEGVALATAIANAISAAALWYVLSKDSGACRVSLRNLKINKTAFLDICHIGFPSGIQSAFFSISNMLIQSSILEVDAALTPPGFTDYDPVVKGNSATTSLENFAFSAINAVVTSASTFTSQNVGINDFRRVRKVLFTVCSLSCAIAVVTTVILMLLSEPLLSFYGVARADDVLGKITFESAMKRVLYKWPPFFLYAMMSTAGGVLRGLGRSVTSAMISLFGTCVFRVAWIYTVFAYFKTLESIYISYAVSWLLTGSVFLVLLAVILKKKIREQDEQIKSV